MDRKIDLTDDRAFSSRRLPKRIVLSPLPWYDVRDEVKDKVAAWYQYRYNDICERCGADTRYLPWQTLLPSLCRRCAGLLSEPEPLWETVQPVDAYEIVFLSEYTARNRG